MSKKVFISYCHRQGEWVWDRLVPCLRCGGADVLIDRERFKAGFGVIEQMNDAQDAAEMSVLVLTPDYLRSDYCLHEMKRAIANRRPDKGLVIPVKREDCPLPDEIESAKPLWVNLCDDKNAGQWDLLLDACGAEIGADAPHWLETRDEVVRCLRRRQSVNLVVKENPKWREMIGHIQSDLLPELGVVDLDSGGATTRRGLVTEILKACGITRRVPSEEDLIELHNALSAREMSHVAMLRLDHATHRNYGVDLFSALRYLIMDSRKMALLAQSRQHFSQLLPQDHPLSTIDLKTVELNGRK
jgi:hypothetical protein